MTLQKKQLLFILIVFAIVIVADQTSKAVIRATVEPNDFRFLHEKPQFFRFTHQYNPDLVGGLGAGNRYFVMGAPIVATFILLFLYRYLEKSSKLQSLAYGLVAGGAIGNLIDRVRLGHVTDFLQFHFYFIPFDFPWKLYPAFNVADSCICTGVFLLILTWHKEKPSHAPDAA